MVIKNPMDLGTIRKNLKYLFDLLLLFLLTCSSKKKYKTIQDVASDIRLVWNNARTFNQTGSLIYEYADTLSKVCNWLLCRFSSSHSLGFRG